MLTVPSKVERKTGTSSITIPPTLMGIVYETSDVYEIIHIKKAVRADPGIQ